jgi:hypothetical protein
MHLKCRDAQQSTSYFGPLRIGKELVLFPASVVPL